MYFFRGLGVREQFFEARFMLRRQHRRLRALFVELGQRRLRAACDHHERSLFIGGERLERSSVRGVVRCVEHLGDVLSVRDFHDREVPLGPREPAIA